MRDELGGTVAFVAPEQITNFRQVQPPVGQYDAGATLYNLLAGQYTYDWQPKLQEQILMILQDPPVSIQSRRPDIPKNLAPIIHRSLAREPKARFGDVREMHQALVSFSS